MTDPFKFLDNFDAYGNERKEPLLDHGPAIVRAKNPVTRAPPSERALARLNHGARGDRYNVQANRRFDAAAMPDVPRRQLFVAPAPRMFRRPYREPYWMASHYGSRPIPKYVRPSFGFMRSTRPVVVRGLHAGRRVQYRLKRPYSTFRKRFTN